MKRRKFLTGAGVVTAWPLVAQARAARLRTMDPSIVPRFFALSRVFREETAFSELSERLQLASRSLSITESQLTISSSRF
jgi:hypothetical protein